MGFAFCATASDCWDESPETAICWWIAVTCLCVGTVIIFLVMSTHRSFELANQAPQIPAAVPVHRTEDNFILGNMSHKLSVPPPYTAEVNIVPNNRLELWKYMHRPFARIAACATGVGLISGSFQVFWWLLARYAVFTDDSRIQNQIRGVQVSVTEVIDAFKFFPILLTVTYLGYRVTKYREWVVQVHTIQANLHSVGLLIGSGVTNPQDIETRRGIFRVYKYLLLLHALCYKNISPTLKGMSIDDDFVKVGLCTKNESKLLMNYANKQRDAVKCWLGGQVHQLVRAGQSDIALPTVTIYLCKIRGDMARFHDMFVRQQPNAFVAVCVVALDIFIALVSLGFPVALLTYDFKNVDNPVICFQPWVFLGVFLVVFAFYGCMHVITLLQNPFNTTIDTIFVDNLMASTERCLFFNMRALFDNGFRDGDGLILPASEVLVKDTAQKQVPETGADGAPNDVTSERILFKLTNPNGP